jgi:hypothetical protein
LAYCYARGFFTGSNAAVLADQFALPLLSLPFFFLVLLLLYNLKEKTYLHKGAYALPNRILIFGFYVVLLLFVGAFGILLFQKATQNGGRDLNIVLPVFAEVIGLLWITSGNKQGKVKRQLLLLALWTGSVLTGFIILGILDKFATTVYTNEERLLFSGLFFHLANTGYGAFQARRFFKEAV